MAAVATHGEECGSIASPSASVEIGIFARSTTTVRIGFGSFDRLDRVRPRQTQSVALLAEVAVGQRTHVGGDFMLDHLLYSRGKM